MLNFFQRIPTAIQTRKAVAGWREADLAIYPSLRKNAKFFFQILERGVQEIILGKIRFCGIKSIFKI